MKNFRNYMPEKYGKSEFQEIEEGIYKTKSPYADKEIFVTSLSFEMEPECFGEEDASPRNLTQIPIEGILDEFSVYVTIFIPCVNFSYNINFCFHQYFFIIYNNDIWC